GPQGTGVLICRGDALPLLRGGTGSNSLEQEMPEFLPDRLEAGTHNVPGVAGLLAGVQFVRKLGVEEISRHAYRLKQQLAGALREEKNIEIFLPTIRSSRPACSPLSPEGRMWGRSASSWAARVLL